MRNSAVIAAFLALLALGCGKTDSTPRTVQAKAEPTAQAPTVEPETART